MKVRMTAKVPRAVTREIPLTLDGCDRLTLLLSSIKGRGVVMRAALENPDAHFDDDMQQGVFDTLDAVINAASEMREIIDMHRRKISRSPR